MKPAPRVFHDISGPINVPVKELTERLDDLRVPRSPQVAKPAPAASKPPRIEPPRPAEGQGIDAAAPFADLATGETDLFCKASIYMPRYLWEEVQMHAKRTRSSLRHIIIKALADSGFEVKPKHLIPDGRRQPR